MLVGRLMPVLGKAIWYCPDLTEADRYAVWNAGYDLATRVYSQQQLLGASRNVQGPVLEEISYWLERLPDHPQFTAAELEGEGWILLAQFDDSSHFAVADAGCLYLVMPESDLAGRRFDRVTGIVQSA